MCLEFFSLSVLGYALRLRCDNQRLEDVWRCWGRVGILYANDLVEQTIALYNGAVFQLLTGV